VCGQALDWLRSDTEAWRMHLKKDANNACPILQRQMQHWLEDSDFSGVRGPEALGNLPEAERKEWQKLWKEVGALKQRVAELPKTAGSARP
jgi:hypothetical protein